MESAFYLNTGGLLVEEVLLNGLQKLLQGDILYSYKLFAEL